VDRHYPVLVAEVGCNHMGDAEIAKRMIKVAAEFCEVDVVKFQKRCPRECLTPERYLAKHPDPRHAFGNTYGEHRERLEFPIRVHAELKANCESAGIQYSSSVWDVTSARELIGLDPLMIKVPSAHNQDFALIRLLAANFRGEIHISLGMTDLHEEELLVRELRKAGRLQDTVLYACTSGYPVPAEGVCLLELSRLQNKYGGTVRGIGFSGHHKGIAIDMAALALGARWIERHFTLDRTLKGTDHAASLEPDGLRRLKRDSLAVASALASKPEAILPIELEQRRKLKFLGMLQSAGSQD
jgi:sialic acid synthase